MFCRVIARLVSLASVFCEANPSLSIEGDKDPKGRRRALGVSAENSAYVALTVLD